MMRKTRLIPTLLRAACNPVATMHGSEAQIERFHRAYSSSKAVDALYAMTGPRFHEVTNRKRFRDLFDE